MNWRGGGEGGIVHVGVPCSRKEKTRAIFLAALNCNVYKLLSIKLLFSTSMMCKESKIVPGGEEKNHHDILIISLYLI
jgi:hypothetical protein